MVVVSALLVSTELPPSPDPPPQAVSSTAPPVVIRKARRLMALMWGEPIVGRVTSGIAFVLDGQPVEVADDGASLLEVLRDRLGRRSIKDGCSPQGQCGCCTVLVMARPVWPA